MSRVQTKAKVVVEEKDVFDTEDLRRRAYAAYYRERDAKSLDGVASQSEVTRIDDKVYSTIYDRDNKKIIALYRIDSFDGHLRRLRRLPRGLIERYEGT